MRSTLDELTKELEDLRTLVRSITPVNDALAKLDDAVIRRYMLIRRRFDYAAFAVALYASFERFVENLVAAYARLESRRLQYVSLPQKLVTKHLSRTAEILSRGRVGEGRYVGLTELGVVKNLFECLNGVTPYTLNEAAVIAHDLNLRVGELDALFAAVGIEQVCDRVRRADTLLEWHRAATEGAAPPEGVPAAIIEERIKGLVDRRNQIAHGGSAPIELLGVAEMHDAINFIEAFSRSLFAMAVGSYLQDHYVTSIKSIRLYLREDDGPYKKGTIVVVKKPAERLFVGQPLFVLVSGTGARWGRIQSIEVDNADVESVEVGTPAPSGVGVRLDFKCPDDATLFALAADDDLVWSPAAVATPPAA